eukprot:7635887-Pyramimonas_sp.AAC.1
MAIGMGDHVFEVRRNEHAPAAKMSRGARCRRTVRPPQVRKCSSRCMARTSPQPPAVENNRKFHPREVTAH